MITARKKRFIEFYLQSWNASEAARKAGYATPGQAGYVLLKDSEIQAGVSARMREAAMGTDEVLLRLKQQATANMADFLIIDTVTDPKTGQSVEQVRVNWEAVRERGYLVRKLSWSRNGDPVLELYDAQNALIQIGRAQKLFVDAVDMTNRLDQVEVKIYIPDNGRDD